MVIVQLHSFISIYLYIGIHTRTLLGFCVNIYINIYIYICPYLLGHLNTKECVFVITYIIYIILTEY